MTPDPTPAARVIAHTEQCSGLLKILLQRLCGLQVTMPPDSHEAFREHIVECANRAERCAYDARFAAREIADGEPDA